MNLWKGREDEMIRKSWEEYERDGSLVSHMRRVLAEDDEIERLAFVMHPIVKVTAVALVLALLVVLAVLGVAIWEAAS